MSEKGVKEAENGGQALKEAGYKFDVAHTSLLTRAQVTLSKVLNAIDQPDLKIEKTWRLNERHYGALTGNLMVFNLRIFILGSEIQKFNFVQIFKSVC